MFIKSLNEEIKTSSAIAVLFFAGCLFTLPILLANVYYIDDLMRSTSGILGWIFLGRPLTDLTFQIVSSSNQAIDIFPLGLIISVLFLTLASMILLITTGIKKKLFTILLFSMIWMNPMMLQNLSYRFDSLSMSLSILSCALAAYFIYNKSFLYTTLSCLFIVCSLSLYQPSVFSFLSCCILISTCKIVNYETNIKDTFIIALKTTISFLAGYYVYSNCLLPYILFSNSRSELIFDSTYPIAHIIGYLKEISIQLFSIYNSGYEPYLIILSIVILVGLITTITSGVINKKSKASILLIIIALFLSPALCFILTFMPTAILKEQITSPRVFMSFGFILSSFFLFTSRSNLASAVAFIVYAIPTLSLSFAYGNALKQQSDYDNFTAWEIISNSKENNETIVFYGENNKPMIVQQIIKEKPFLKYLVSPSYDWTMTMRLQNNNFNNVSFSFDRKLKIRLAETACIEKITPKDIIGNIKSYSLNNYKLISLSGFLTCN